MLQSMTGFGKAVATHAGGTITADVRTLNGRYCDVALRMPAAYRSKDVELRGWLAKELVRGKIDVMINVTGMASAGSINTSLFKSYYDQLASLAEELGTSAPHLADSILQLPDVIATEDDALDEGLWAATFDAIKEAAKEVTSFRREEGSAMREDLVKRLRVVKGDLQQIQEVAPTREQRIRERIDNGLSEFVKEEQVDRNRFEQELLYYLEKMDVNEELVRLESHIDHFMKTVDGTEVEKGKKLGFIAQEMTREVNTISSKANDATMQQIVVGMKDELEKVKELLLNVL